MKGLLHYFRRYEFCRDVIILASKTTPSDYLRYLDDRKYDCIIAGDAFVYYKRALEELASKYKVGTILVGSSSARPRRSGRRTQSV